MPGEERAPGVVPNATAARSVEPTMSVNSTVARTRSNTDSSSFNDARKASTRASIWAWSREPGHHR
jgi:hypothetical protein